LSTSYGGAKIENCISHENKLLSGAYAPLLFLTNNREQLRTKTQTEFKE
jgi:hypothetical protein